MSATTRDISRRRAAPWRRLPAAYPRETGLTAMTALLILAIVFRAPDYLAAKNIDNLLFNYSFLAILVLGQLPVLASRGIDLSQDSVLAFAGMFLALLSQQVPGLAMPAYLALALVIGGGLGAVNGAVIAATRIPPIIMTLGTMTVYRGLVYVLSGGAWVSSHEISAPFKSVATTGLFGLPLVIWIMLGAAAGLVWLLSFTRAGRDVYAIGGNPEAAALVGLSARRAEMLVYTLSGALAGLVGYLWTARFSIAYTQVAEGRIFAIIAACVIGGISIAGGRGTVAGALLGALFITVIETALPFLRISPFAQKAILGAVILIAVAANARGERGGGRRILPSAAAETGR